MKHALIVGMGKRSSLEPILALAEIENFIKKNGYTYDAKDLIDGLKKRKDGQYNSYTMGHCLDNLTASLEILSESIAQR